MIALSRSRRIRGNSLAPDLIIGPVDRPYIYRWHLFQIAGRQLALHKIMRSDDSRALHDHKADNWSFILWGEYTEITPFARAVWGPLSFIRRKAEDAHRLIVDKPVWTLWYRGKPRRMWGFYAQEGWLPAPEYWARYGDES